VGQCLPDLLTAGSAAKKGADAPARKEIRVLSRDEIVPTYRIPPLVRECQVRWGRLHSNQRPVDYERVESFISRP
jgi:hypothetical protein